MFGIILKLFKFHINGKKVGRKVQKSVSRQKLVFFISTFQEQVRWSAPNIENRNFSWSERSLAVLYDIFWKLVHQLYQEHPL